MTFLRSFADDMPLSDWLYQQVFPNEAKLDDEMIYTFTKARDNGISLLRDHIEL